MERTFRDRADAGRRLAEALSAYADRPDVLVLGLPRGGVPVAAEVARALRAPLDVFVVRKLGVPDNPELAMGAIATGGVRIVNTPVVRALHIPDSVLDAVAAREEAELRRRERAYRGHEGAPEVAGKTILLVDDGIATGSTIRAAIQALRRQGPARLVVAAPTAALDTCAQLRPQVDELVTLLTPADFVAVGQCYQNFGQTTDAEVTGLLARPGVA